MTYNKIIDISWPLHNSTATYPGNPQIRIKNIVSLTGKSLISEIGMGSHSGTHIDAPKHVFDNGFTIDKLNLNNFLGLCRVVDLTRNTKHIDADDLEKFAPKAGERLLLKTRNSNLSTTLFSKDFVFLTPDAANYLADKQIMLMGIDYLSIKEKGAVDNRAHTLLLSQNIPIVEGLRLQGIKPGEYFLICFPLLFTDLEASPCRAILLDR